MCETAKLQYGQFVIALTYRLSGSRNGGKWGHAPRTQSH